MEKLKSLQVYFMNAALAVLFIISVGHGAKLDLLEKWVEGSKVSLRFANGAESTTAYDGDGLSVLEGIEKGNSYLLKDYFILTKDLKSDYKDTAVTVIGFKVDNHSRRSIVVFCWRDYRKHVETLTPAEFNAYRH